MVIPFPAVKAATQPINTLFARCIGFLEGFEDDPDQVGVGLLLQQLRSAQPGLLFLPAPDTKAPRCQPGTDLAITYFANRDDFAFLVRRDDEDYAAGLYRWTARRYDDTGRVWRTTGLGVVDDFGNLVEVPA